VDQIIFTHNFIHTTLLNCWINIAGSSGTCEHGVLNYCPSRSKDIKHTSCSQSGSVGHTKSTGDERFWHACSVQPLLIFEHFLSVNFQPQLNTHTQTHTPTHTHTDKQYQYDTASHYYVCRCGLLLQTE